MKHPGVRTRTAPGLEAELAALGSCLAEVGMPLRPQQVAALRHYAQLLLAWNRRTNLVAPGDEPVIVPRHIAESLAFLTVEEIAHGAMVVDIGSGGGLPGVPMKIVRPDLQMLFLEAQRRKVLFLQEVVDELQLQGACALSARAEMLANLPEWQGKVDVVVARAVAKLATLWAWAAPLLGLQGKLITLKGGDVGAELRVLAAQEPSLSVRLAAPPSCLVAPDKGRVLIIVQRGTQT